MPTDWLHISANGSKSGGIYFFRATMGRFIRATESHGRCKIPENARDQDYRLVTDLVALFDVTDQLALVR